MSMAWLITASLVATRLFGVITMMPAFSSGGVPKQLRLAAALALTVVITPIVPSAGPTPTFYILLLGIASEFFIGIIMGGTVNVIFASFSMGAEAMGMQIGLRIASVFDPVGKSQTGLIGSFCRWMSVLVFLGANLHLKMLAAVSNSFHTVPPGSASDPLMAATLWAPAVAEAMAAGARLAGPVIILILLIQTMLGVMIRLAPSMNVFFAVGLTVTIYTGVALVDDALPVMLSEHLRIMTASLDFIPAVANLVK